MSAKQTHTDQLVLKATRKYQEVLEVLTTTGSGKSKRLLFTVMMSSSGKEKSSVKETFLKADPALTLRA